MANGRTPNLTTKNFHQSKKHKVIMNNANALDSKIKTKAKHHHKKRMARLIKGEERKVPGKTKKSNTMYSETMKTISQVIEKSVTSSMINSNDVSPIYPI